MLISYWSSDVAIPISFVAGGLYRCINTGLLNETEEPGEVIGVIAHETGHIAGGHIARSGAAMEQTYATLIATYLLGLGAALATGEAGVGAAVLSGGQDIALRSLLQYTRTQETSADQAAVNLLRATQQSPAGMLERSEAHTSELQSLMRISYAVFCLKKKKIRIHGK